MPTLDLEGAAYAEAAEQYQTLWAREGTRIVSGLEAATSLRFRETYIHAVVYSGPSHSHPLSLRAEYPDSVKLGTLVHELGHRLVHGARNPRVHVSSDRRPSSKDLHKNLDLFLYDTLTQLYGDEFAQEQLAFERDLTPMYADCWDWALAFDRDTRAELFRQSLVHTSTGPL